MRLDEVFAAAARRSGPAIVRLCVPLPPIAPLGWLRLQGTGTRLYWSDRRGQCETAGFGVADCAGGTEPPRGADFLARLRRRLDPETPHLRYFGGMGFDAQRTVPASWAPFGAYWFALPRFDLTRRGDRTELACTVRPDRDHPRRGVFLRAIETMRFPAGDTRAALPRVADRRDRPSLREWNDLVTGALSSFSDHRLLKVVLARETTLRFSGKLDPILLLQRLRPVTPRCYHFLFQPDGAGPAFLGASPERLYHRIGRTVRTESLAGTRPRGRDSSADAAFEGELLESEKELREHQYVVDSVRAALRRLCRSARGGEAKSILKLSDVQHVVSRFEGELADGVSDERILDLLHPTPAVGGVPSDGARRMIREVEPFERGWYAGPVGWVGREGAEFAVAIRSALARATEIRLFSGAGILHGSSPEREWSEIESKIEQYLAVLLSQNDV